MTAPPWAEGWLRLTARSKRLFACSEVAELLDVTPRAVSGWIAQGHLEAFRLPGGQFRIPREAVEAITGPLEQLGRRYGG